MAVETPHTDEGQLSSLETLIERGKKRKRLDIHLEMRIGRKEKKRK